MRVFRLDLHQLVVEIGMASKSLSNGHTTANQVRSVAQGPFSGPVLNGCGKNKLTAGHVHMYCVSHVARLSYISLIGQIQI